MNGLAVRWKSVACLFVLAVGLMSDLARDLSGVRLMAQETLRADHPDAASTIPTTADAQFYLNNDSTLRRWLKDGRSRLDAGLFVEGLTIWQRILDRGDDGFVRLQSEGPWVGVRHEVQRGISELPANGRETYERLFGAAARRLFDQSLRTGRPLYANEVLRRYYHTEAGFEAARWLARRWLDHGQPRLAARILERLWGDPVHRSRINQDLTLLAAVAHRQAGNEPRVQELLQELAGVSIRIAGVSSTAPQWLDQVVSPHRSANGTATPSGSADWLSVGGDNTRSATRRGSTPWLQPLWPPVSLVTHPADRSAIQEWMDSQAEHHLQQLAIAAEPLVVRGQLIARDLQGLSAYDLQTGRRLWTFPAKLPFHEWLPRVMAQNQETNRAGAVQEALITNSAFGTLSSDGQYVFAIDLLPLEMLPSPEADNANAKSELAALTQLVALPISSLDSSTEAADRSRRESVPIARPAWTLDLIAAASKLGHRGSGIQALGPPVVVDDCLYLMGELFSLDAFSGEKNSQLCLLAIDRLSGEPLWSQGLALVDEPFFRSQQQGRRNPVGVPTYVDGMLICPTDVGLIVGVDLVTGRQRWVHGYQMGEPGQRRDSFPEERGWSGTPTWPIVHRDRVLILSRFSSELKCLEATTGRLLWQIPREEAMCIGAVTDDRVLLVDSRHIRAIPIPPDGTVTKTPVAPLWTLSVGPISGRSVRVGDDLLVPLKSGRVACVEISTGIDRGFAVTRTTSSRGWHDEHSAVAVPQELSENDLAPWPGNLIACGDVVVSMGLTHLAVYPQAQAKLRSLAQQPESIERRLLESELTMLLGTKSAPIEELQRLLRQPLSPELRVRAERQLRESLYLELRRQPDRSEWLLEQLEPLANTTAERARLLQRICEVSLPRNSVRTVQAARELAALSLDHELELDEHSQHAVSLETWARGYLRQVLARVKESPAEADPVLDVLDQERDRLLASGDLSAMRQFVRLCDEWPQSVALRSELARRLIEQGEFQEAELLFVRDRLSQDPAIAAAATARLLWLWDHFGLSGLAANLLAELADRFGDVRFEATLKSRASEEDRRVVLTGREFVARFPRESLTWQAFVRLRPPDWDVRRVEITEDRASAVELRLVEAFANGDIRNRAFVRSSAGTHLFQVRPMFQKFGDPFWQIVDRDSAVVTGQLPQLDRFYPTGLLSGPPEAANHLFPVGGPGRMLGFSLLGHDQQDPTWNTSFAPLRATQEFLRVGPVGPNFCVFQSRQHLVVIDPASGKLAWRRVLEPNSGLMAESDTGLFGDREVLVVFGSDQSSFTIYETATGRELRRGRLPPDQHSNRRPFGRKLFHILDGNEGRRLRIWDPLSDLNELDEPFTGHLSVIVTAEGELLLLQAGRLRVLDVHHGLVKLDVNLGEEHVRGANTVRAFSDADRYYINLQRVLDNSDRLPFSYFLNDSLIPKAEVLGELYAFSRPTNPVSLSELANPRRPLGKKLWMRVLPQRTVLRLDNARLPFLVMLSRQQDRSRTDKSALRVEAVDALTGNLLGSHSHVLTTRLVQTQHDPHAARLTIVGLTTRMHLDYGRDKQRMVEIGDPW
jgi:outer membrane protein assembly factor BamB